MAAEECLASSPGALDENRKREPGPWWLLVTSQKYQPVRNAILASLPRGRNGLTFQELVDSVARTLPKSLFPRPGSVSWYTKVVQLDLEAKGLIERIPGRSLSVSAGEPDLAPAGGASTGTRSIAQRLVGHAAPVSAPRIVQVCRGVNIRIIVETESFALGRTGRRSLEGAAQPAFVGVDHTLPFPCQGRGLPPLMSSRTSSHLALPTGRAMWAVFGYKPRFGG